jgi:hypothetical protein
LRSMFLLWNPESSKWAAQASRKYHKALPERPDRPRDWYEEPDKDKRIDRTVLVEQCGCKRKISAHTMVDYQGGDHGNSSMSTCSFHSFYRGAKQKVMRKNIFLFSISSFNNANFIIIGCGIFVLRKSKFNARKREKILSGNQR